MNFCTTSNTDNQRHKETPENTPSEKDPKHTHTHIHTIEHQSVFKKNDFFASNNMGGI